MSKKIDEDGITVAFEDEDGRATPPYGSVSRSNSTTSTIPADQPRQISRPAAKNNLLCCTAAKGGLISEAIFTLVPRAGPSILKKCANSLSLTFLL